MVGYNGSWKSSLLEIIIGRKKSSNGTVYCDCNVSYMPQQIIFKNKLKVSDFIFTQKYETFRNKWNLDSRLKEALISFRFNTSILNHNVLKLSGGELTKIYIIKLLMESPDILIMDEPANNLDDDSQKTLCLLLKNWQKGLLIVSHNKDLMRCVDKIFELSPIGFKKYNGNYDYYEKLRINYNKNSQKKIKIAKQELKKTMYTIEKEKFKDQKKQSRGKGIKKRKKQDKITLNNKQSKNEKTKSKFLKLSKKKSNSLKHDIEKINKEIIDIKTIKAFMNSCNINSKKRILIIENLTFFYSKTEARIIKNFNLNITGPQRVWLKGNNGSGKTTLINIINNSSKNFDNMKLFHNY